MKIFPEENLIIKLSTDKYNAISELKKNTLHKDQYVGNWNGQQFIGVISESEFQIKLSKRIYGGFCLFQGHLENVHGSLIIKLSKIVKLLFYIIIAFIISGLIVAIVQKNNAIIIQSILSPILFWIFIQIGFKIISKKGIRKLKETIPLNIISQKNEGL
ncbi:hypothetical protein ACNKXS_14955 [Christiangramia marina]|uniref:hypothetical protein n=1 Tax=Christiangramia marina TaxID=409436 RepID=UPI003AA96ED3